VALITRHSVHELALKPGSAVSVSFKASAVHVIERGEGGASAG
jgi:molybdopterin-binding protein